MADYPERDDDADTDPAETFDEETVGAADDGEADPEDLVDLLDVTRAEGDADEDDEDSEIGEDLDDDEIVDAEQDEPLADPEDDDLAARGDEYQEDLSVDVDSIPRSTRGR
jgi:hypothetical protein